MIQTMEKLREAMAALKNMEAIRAYDQWGNMGCIHVTPGDVPRYRDVPPELEGEPVPLEEVEGVLKKGGWFEVWYNQPRNEAGAIFAQDAGADGNRP